MDVLKGLGAWIAGLTGFSVSRRLAPLQYRRSTLIDLQEIPFIRERLVANEMAKKVKEVGERLGRPLGLWR